MNKFFPVTVTIFDYSSWDIEIQSLVGFVFRQVLPPKKVQVIFSKKVQFDLKYLQNG